jgi:RecA/RadA recombinase
MSIEIIGSHLPCERTILNLYSLDRAFVNDVGELGCPVGIGYEIFGGNHVGKSTFVYSLAGLLTESNIVLSDFEGFDPEFLRSVLSTIGFEGTVNTLREHEDEDQLGELITLLKSDDYSIGIIDSIGAISPISETEGDLGEANMGRRAMIMAQFTRKAMKMLRFTDGNTILAVNHWYPRIGSRGYQSPGGEVKNYLFSVRILLKRKHEFLDGSYILEGTVRKNRWGYKDKVFYVFILAGRGLHKGLTALWDCVLLDKAKYGKGGYVKIEKENMGRLSALAKKAKEGNDEIFEPFMELLNEEERMPE